MGSSGRHHLQGCSRNLTAAMDSPVVDVIVAVHTAARPVQRAVASVLVGTKASVRVTVVCHNVHPPLISANLSDYADDPRVRLMNLQDGVPSPAGPFNAGLDAATAPFTSVLGSDDYLEPGAVDSWLALARKNDAAAIIPRVKFSSGASLRTPPVRPFRSNRLDGVKDRLAYRTAQLGLVSRTKFPSLRFTTGLRSGEDIEYGLRLWFSGERISFDRKGPGYVITVDDADRTTVTPKSVSEDFAFLDRLEEPFSASLTEAVREAIAVKILRTHVMDALSSRYLHGSPSASEQSELGTIVRRLHAFSSSAADILSIRDRRILDSVLAEAPDAVQMREDLRLRTDFRRYQNVCSASIGRVLHREAPLRFLAALAVTP